MSFTPFSSFLGILICNGICFFHTLFPFLYIVSMVIRTRLCTVQKAYQLEAWMISQTEDRMVNNLSLQSGYSYRHIPVWSEALSSLIFVAQLVFKHLQQCLVHMLHLAISHRVIRCCSGTATLSFFN